MYTHRCYELAGERHGKAKKHLAAIHCTYAHRCYELAGEQQHGKAEKPGSGVRKQSPLTFQHYDNLARLYNTVRNR